MQIAISISDIVGSPTVRVVFFSIVMDVLDDYNGPDYYTPTIAQEIYLSPCFHYFIHTRLSHTLYCETHTYGSTTSTSSIRTLNDLRFTFVCEGEQFRIRRRDTIALAGERKKSERDQGRGHTQHNMYYKEETKIQTWCERCEPELA